MGDLQLTKEETKVIKLFQTMVYPKEKENLEKALAWFQNRNKIFAYIEKVDEQPEGTPIYFKNVLNGEVLSTVYRPEVDTVKKIVQKCYDQIKWFDTAVFERGKLLSRLGSEIEKNKDLIGQIELVSRGILIKDTVQLVPLLAQYFNFYSGFATLHGLKKCQYKPSGVSIAVISNENALSNIGLFLAPALAAGHNVIIQAGLQIIPSIILIVELAEKVGIPQGVIRVIPSDDGELLPYLSDDNVKTVALFVDLSNEKYRGINNLNKKVLALSSYKTSIIVFDNADLDSACNSVIEAVWSYRGLLPWAANTIIVQENIFSTFINKLKNKLELLKVGDGSEKPVDIATPADVSVVVEAAKSQCLEIFQTASSLLLLIGGKFQGENNEDIIAKTLFANVLPFRSIDEAVNLANNTKQGLGAMLWSENLGIINEVAHKLIATNIWINSSGFISAADVTFSPIKESGAGWFGGREGFNEYIQYDQKIKASVQTKLKPCAAQANLTMGIVNSAKKAQENWSKIPFVRKGKLLQEFAEYLEDNKKEFSKNLSEQWINSWIQTIFKSITNPFQTSFVTIHSGYYLSSNRLPRGILVIEVNKNLNFTITELIVKALIYANSVILLNDNPSAETLLKELSKKFPSGVLNILPYTVENVESISKHKNINGYFGNNEDNAIFGFLPIQDAKIFRYIEDSSENVYQHVTFAKNIWSDIGKSSSCSFGGY